jgi:hypothetical protein
MDALHTNFEWSGPLPLGLHALVGFPSAYSVLLTGDLPWFYYVEFRHFFPVSGLMYRGYAFVGMCGGVRIPSLDFTWYYHVTTSAPYNALHSVSGEDGLAYPSYDDQAVSLFNNAQKASARKSGDMDLDHADHVQDAAEDESIDMPVNSPSHAHHFSHHEIMDMIMGPADDAIFIPAIMDEYMDLDLPGPAQVLSEQGSALVAQYIARLEDMLASEGGEMPQDVVMHDGKLESESEDVPMGVADHAQDLLESKSVDMQLDLDGPRPQNGVWEIDVDATMSHQELQAAASIQDRIMAFLDN